MCELEEGQMEQRRRRVAEKWVRTEKCPRGLFIRA